MDMRISPSRLSGAVDAVSSKSFAHRLLICAALAQKETRIRIHGMSDDVLSTIQCIKAMGCAVKIERTEILVSPAQERPAGAVELDCGQSASTARFLMPVAARLFEKFSMTGQGRLPKRPMHPLCEAMERAGCRFDNDHLPLTCEGKMASGNFKIGGDVSSQFASGLLLALPLMDAGSSVEIVGHLESAGYVNMTVEAIALFGVAIEKNEDGAYRITGNRRYDSPGLAVPEGDWSNAAFFLCSGAMGGGAVTVRGLSTGSEQRDKEVVDALGRFGAKVEVDEAAGTVSASSSGRLRATEIDATHVTDLIPALAVVASVAEGETRIVNAQRLRFKESDRIKSTCAMLSALGADARATSDGIVIRGKQRLRGGVVNGAGDHRIVMAAATAACACERQVLIEDFLSVNKSYPTFFGDFKTLKGISDVV